MQEFSINGRNQLCYLVSEGETAFVVIPVDSLASVDRRRLHALEAKGGEMMAVMRDTRLDNGVNALVQYQNLLVFVQKERPAPKPVKEVSAPATEATDAVEEKAPKKEAPRRGRRARSAS